MITRVESLRFRSLLHVEQDLESFQVLVGPNGSGKSSFLDVVGFIGDLLRVGPLRAIRGDERAGVPPRTSDPANLIWMRQGEEFELAVELLIPPERSDKVNGGKYKRARYELGVRVAKTDGEVALTTESLFLAPEPESPHPSQPMLFPRRKAPPDTILYSRHPRAPASWKKVVNKIGESGNY
jgi:hypothetical protein